MEKLEIVKQAYVLNGYNWDDVKQYVDENGWCNCRIVHELALSGSQEDSKCGYYVRPKSISGIENNNGWIKIESEEDLPKEDCDCFVRFSDGEIRCDRFLVNHKNFITTHYVHVTHYQPIEKPKPPIY